MTIYIDLKGKIKGTNRISLAFYEKYVLIRGGAVVLLRKEVSCCVSGRFLVALGMTGKYCHPERSVSGVRDLTVQVLGGFCGTHGEEVSFCKECFAKKFHTLSLADSSLRSE